MTGAPQNDAAMAQLQNANNSQVNSGNGQQRLTPQQQQQVRVNNQRLVRILNSIQAPPGMTRQQRLQEMIRSGQLSREDISILHRHQQMVKHQQQAQINASRQATGSPVLQQQMMASGSPVNRPANITNTPNANQVNIGTPRVQGQRIGPSSGSPSGAVNNNSASSPVQRKNSSPQITQITQHQQQQRFLAAQQIRQQQVQQQQHQAQVQLRQQQAQAQAQAKAHHQSNSLNLPHDQTGKMINPQHQQRNSFGLTTEQFSKLTPQQRKMIMVQQLRKRAKAQRYYESNEELLKKYEKYPASLEFHIHENHYRFGNQEMVIPKNSETIKEFLEYVARGEIPEALVEVIKDGGLQLYDASLILKVFDHRNLIVVTTDKNVKNEASVNVGNPGVGSNGTPKPVESRTNSIDPNSNITNKSSTPATDVIKRPKEYRTVLRLTQLAQYDDLSFQTDTQQFHDTFALTFESEVLAATNRNLNLQPILNPYHYDKSLRPCDMVKPKYNRELDKVEFEYRDDQRELLMGSLSISASNNIFDDTSKGDPNFKLTYENYPYRPLHEDQAQSNSKYEQIMTILNDTYSHTNKLSMNSNAPQNESGQFQRLRFIEMWRHKVAMIKQAASSTQGMGNNTNDPSGGGMNGLLGGLTAQQRVLINQERLLNQSQKEQMAAAVAAQQSRSASSMGLNNPSMVNNNNSSANDSPKKSSTPQPTQSSTPQPTNSGSSSNGNNNKSNVPNPSTGSKKPKKPRRPTKKQLAAQAAANSAAQQQQQQHYAVSGKTLPGQYSDKTLPGGVKVKAEDQGAGGPSKKKRITKKKSITGSKN